MRRFLRRPLATVAQSAALHALATLMLITAHVALGGRPVVAAEITPIAASDVALFTGSSYELGTQHGTKFRQEIDALFQTFLKPDVSTPTAWAWALSLARQMEPRIPDDYKAEIRGIADSTGRAYEEVLVGNIIPELGQFRMRPLGCSTFVVMPSRSATGFMTLGRNLDYDHPEILSPLVRPMVFAASGKKRILSVGFPGMVGVLTGVNDSGVSLSQMYSQHSDQDTAGIPTTILYREILAVAYNLSEAIAQLTQTSPRATATNTMATDGRDAAVVELTARHSAVRVANSASGTLYSANHFESPALLTPGVAPARDGRWPVLGRHDATRDLLSFESARAVIADAGRDTGNVLAFFVDYADKRALFGHSSRPAADGDFFAIQLDELWAD